ncbi:MAG: hypothetical protein DI632_06060 [Sphingomonas hengshuiensis]|uniref:FecR protein domain-containing protein n=1 Tax=Sphingomonas hengshuiensis TaxID=1609977 RepID=A0A2W5B7F6_9SPHN|nr:MAG: hypothetical protein DI632_06060 [Sphingomonas hengshuiensis]
MSRAATVEEDAARWLMRREDAAWSAADERALAAWLGASSAHQAAFWRLEAGWAAADRVAALGTVVPQATTRRRWPLRVALPRLRPAGRWVPAAVAASLLLAIGGTAWRQGMLSPPAEPAIAYHTPVGGYRVVALDDGSRVEMNTATRLRAAPRGGTREVWLDSGEAFFDIAHRDDRRFVVHAGPRTVTVLGTRFSVRRDGDRVTVAVVSGRVRIDDARGVEGAHAALVGKGDVAVARPGETLVQVAPGRVEASTAWRDGMLVFDQSSLADAIGEFNRYERVPVRIRDAELGRMSIGGAFQIGRRAAFLDLLRSAYGVKADRLPDGSVELHR